MSDQDVAAAPKRRTSMTFFRRVLRVMVVAYIAILVLMTVFESRLVFPGAYRTDLEHDASGATAWTTEYSIGEEDPRALTGHWIERPTAERTVIFFHGNGTNATRQIPWGYQLSAAWNANVLIAEYRSFTEPDLTPSELNVIEDALAAFDGLCDSKSLRPEEVIVFGRSLGGGCAAAVAAQRKIRGLVLDRTFDSAVSVAAGRFPWVPVR
ncbi:MAG: alpha/beta fold hydrolase, partial [Planctomycetota bacterium]